MNILMVSNTYTPIMGGLEKSIQAFTQHYRKLGHKVMLVVPEYKGHEEKEFGVVRVPAIQNFNGSDFSVNLPIPGNLSNVVEVFRPDIVHAHHPFLMGDLAMRLAGQYQIPLIFTHHTMFEQYSDFILSTEPGKNFVVELAAGFAGMADYVVAPGEDVRKSLIAKGVSSPIEVIPTGVETEIFKKGNGAALRRKLRIPARAFTLGYAGRISPEKNLGFLAEAVSQFLKNNKGTYFIVAGKGSYMPELKKIFTEQKLMKQVRFAGVLKGAHLVAAYHAMNAFVFASQSETQGMVITEAMAAGTPVVALDAPGVRDVVEDGKNGRLVGNHDAAEFAEALLSLKKLPAAKRKKMKADCLATAEKFSMKNSVQKMLALYERARLEKSRSVWAHNGVLESFLNRIKTEWDMLANLGKAAGSAIVEAAKPSEPAAEKPAEEEPPQESRAEERVPA